ncbi:hypothetical protein HHX47_DHR8000467 [Lentinula edodes]|nr:hypothetical protein HHX47_DHR8000467 [Lentinula edodes]
MPNPSGSNGHQNGTRPSDDHLHELLHEYAHRNLSLKQRLLYLEKEGYKIGKSTLKNLNRKFKVPTVNKPPPMPVAITLVSKAVSQDSAARNGPSTIQGNLRQNKNVFIPRSLFNWLWPKIVQLAVDEFVDYWNNHKTRAQRAANLPSGVAPNVVFDFPENYGLVNCGIPVEIEDIAALRETLPRSREDCYEWVSKEFDQTASDVYSQLGSPTLNHTTGWQIFADMLKRLE